ncbi:asparaginase [uncultured Kocuria sp.]|uniref:asparaginase n=1 Tax=uncultured Kocuria sp. TaxID=259305 RepID=UPI002592A375|nr:asparaginase [uncultured Kocuria sp.]MCT1368533.1 asparaginase [Rothia sp. p3-SID1597]
METFSADRAAELAVVERSGFVESRHLGAAAVVSPEGELVRSLGDSAAAIYPRSALKPFQAIASLKAGAPLRGAQVAIAAGSHEGSFEHMKVVAGMLQAAGLTPEHLQCPAAYPKDDAARAYLVSHEKGRQRIAFNCSGKHAAFLWACAHNDWDTETYLEPDHPLQRLVLEIVEEATGERVQHVGVDGCGAPVPTISLNGLAKAYSTLGAGIRNISADARTATMATAMNDYPEMVQNHGRPNTLVMEELDVVAKFGAEGILAIGTREGAGVAVKALDGSPRAVTMVALSLLAQEGYVDPQIAEDLISRTTPPINGADVRVGEIRLGGAFNPEATVEDDPGVADASEGLE